MKKTFLKATMLAGLGLLGISGVSGLALAHPSSSSHSHMNAAEFLMHWLSALDHLAMLVGIVAATFLLIRRAKSTKREGIKIRRNEHKK